MNASNLLLVLILSAGVQASAAEFTPGRGVIAASDDLHQLLVQSTAEDGHVTFELCALESSGSQFTESVVGALREGSASCTPLISGGLNGADQKMMDFARDKFVGLFSARAPEKMAQLKGVALDFGVKGTLFMGLVGAGSSMLFSDLIKKQARHPKLALVGRLSVHSAVVLGAASAIYVAVKSFRDAQGIAPAQVQVDLMGVRGELTSANFPMVSAAAFDLITSALAEAVAETHRALLIR